MTFKVEITKHTGNGSPDVPTVHQLYTQEFDDLDIREIIAFLNAVPETRPNRPKRVRSGESTRRPGRPKKEELAPTQTPIRSPL